ncbi:hypothetical protein [Rubritalea tangerina]|uniref:Acyl-protein synthetase LuxE domain-containing protein n=1 Tax=Rubritalea tangerina TaxID=430798 RepID=A0ABW4Z6N8_9BACT
MRFPFTPILYAIPQHIMPDYQLLLAEIDCFIRSPHRSQHDFDSLALLLHGYQKANNPNYAALCHQSKAHAHNDIPALTTDAFKFHSPPSCLTDKQIATTFMTSGTTGEMRGKHHFRDTTLYETSIIECWKNLKLPKINTLLILTPTPHEAPHSSLAHMMETLRTHLSPSANYLINQDTIYLQLLKDTVASGKPVTLLGTALAFLNLFEQLDQPLSLPPGSWAMETGGYKGSGRDLNKQNLYQQFQSFLSLPPDSIWNEYSMTELSSQFYTHGLDRPHNAPHWTKISVIDPETDLPVNPGDSGYLVIHDLANIDSVAKIRTQDIAIYHDERTFTLIGRDPSALPRGCSRSIDEALNASE